MLLLILTIIALVLAAGAWLTCEYEAIIPALLAPFVLYALAAAFVFVASNGVSSLPTL